MRPLSISSCQARNTYPLTAALASYLQEQLQITVQYLDMTGSADRYRQLDHGEIDIAWICGWPYATRIDNQIGNIELLVAPVMQGDRYQNRPIYFSDVVVRKDSPYQSFFDLQGRRWAFNESGSQSGCHVVRYYLALTGQMANFFGQVVGSGGHINSIDMVLEGEIDGAAIDSTVWDWEIAQRPALLNKLRVLKMLGPSAMPPLVIQKSIPSQLRQNIRQALLTLHRTQQGRDILQLGQLHSFAAVQDQNYDEIRFMGKIARQVRLTPEDSYFQESTT